MTSPLEVLQDDISRGRTAGRLHESEGITDNYASLALATIALIAAVSSQSAWIDEAVTGVVSRQPTLEAWWQILTVNKGSDLQMPLYVFYVWVCEKIVGSTELTLRALGLLWLIPGVLIFVSGFRRERERMAAALVIATSAFVWYYANEARPYAMQVGASCALAGALYRLSGNGRSTGREPVWLGVFAVALVTLSGSSMLGMIWAAAALASAWVLVPSERLLTYWRQYRFGVVLVTLVLFVIGLFYLWTLMSGARASAAARTDLQTMIYVFYEQFGFTGLGPGRTEIRESPIRALMPFLPILAAYAALLAAVLGAGFYAVLQSPAVRRAAMLLAAVAAPAMLLVLAAVVTHFRLLGRHWAPLMPIWFLVLVIGVLWLWERPRWLGKAAVVAFFALSLWSCLEVRFAARHARDDYRSAAEAANVALAGNETVWWNAAEGGAQFYYVPLTDKAEEKGKAILVNSPDLASLAGLGRPDVIIASKADLYDNTGAVAEYIAAGRFRPIATYTAFTVWRRDNGGSASRFGAPGATLTSIVDHRLMASTAPARIGPSTAVTSEY